MILEQFYLGCLAHASYLLGDEVTKTAIIVDPRRDVQVYIDAAQHHGLTIKHVFLTHFHADYLAGHLELRDLCGATIHLGTQARADYEFEPMTDGQVLTWGNTSLSILETPGHTPESISLVVHDLASDSPNIPHAVLTGDTLFIGDVGRPDLMASIGVTAEELASSLFDSLRQKLMTLPDETLLYPGHGAGSLCGKNLSRNTVCTIGDQKRLNYALQPMEKATFVEMLTSEQPPTPAYFGFDADLNKREHPTLTMSLETFLPMSLRSILELQQDEDFTLVDTRTSAEFAKGYLRGSLNIGLEGQFATWSGSVLPTDGPIAVITEKGKEQEAAIRLGRIGFDNVVGFLEGGPDSFSSFPDLIDSQKRLNTTELSSKLEGEPSEVFLDVRSASEFDNKRVSGSQVIPLAELQDRLADLPTDTGIITFCRTGYRSSLAASILRASGFDDVIDAHEGIVGWEQEGGLIVTNDTP